MADSVPLAAPAEARPPARAARLGNFKALFALFLAFLAVVSDSFTTHVLSGFGEKAVRLRRPTAWGVALQGLFLVMFYALACYLMEHGVL